MEVASWNATRARSFCAESTIGRTIPDTRFFTRPIHPQPTVKNAYQTRTEALFRQPSLAVTANIEAKRKFAAIVTEHGRDSSYYFLLIETISFAACRDYKNLIV